MGGFVVPFFTVRRCKGKTYKRSSTTAYFVSMFVTPYMLWATPKGLHCTSHCPRVVGDLRQQHKYAKVRQILKWLMLFNSETNKEVREPCPWSQCFGQKTSSHTFLPGGTAGGTGPVCHPLATPLLTSRTASLPCKRRWALWPSGPLAAVLCRLES